MELPKVVQERRFSLRSLILVMTAACLLLGTWSLYVNPFRQQAQSLALVNRLKGEAQIVPSEGPAWQRWLVESVVGDETFVEVDNVDLSARKVEDNDLQGLTGLKFLRELNLDRTQITDAGGSTLRLFPKLEKLSLRFTKLTDQTAAHLAALPSLNYLYVTSTQLTDAAAPELAKLKNLKELYARWSHISDAGADKIRQAIPGCQVYNSPLVSDVATK